jgi:hypothetical protein
VLTKSDLLSFAQCPRKLWLERHATHVTRDSPAPNYRLLYYGAETDAKARDLLGPQKIAYPRERGEHADTEQARAGLIAAPQLAATEFPMRHGGLFVRADALIPADGRYVLRETKASTFADDDQPKMHHVLDAAVQHWVMVGSGIPLARVELNLLNRSWRYGGDGDYSGLFCQLDITEATTALLPEVGDCVEEASAAMQGQMPNASTGAQCNTPYACVFRPFCESLEPPKPQASLELLPGQAGKALAKKLRAKGHQSLLELTPDHFTGAHAQLFRRIHHAHMTGAAVLDDSARTAITDLPYPRYFLDFEGIDFAVPRWRGFRPYEHAPFQWSCDVEVENGRFEHYDFLDLSGSDPSRSCIEQLRNTINPYDAGPIIVYNAGYEKTVLLALADRNPDYGELVDTYVERLIDLLQVVKGGFYDARMHGSFSLKSVLPTVAPDLAYDDLTEVHDGTTAQTAYLIATCESSLPAERKKEIETRLIAYCRRDTWAMVAVTHFLAGRPRPLRPTYPDR